MAQTTAEAVESTTTNGAAPPGVSAPVPDPVPEQKPRRVSRGFGSLQSKLLAMLLLTSIVSTAVVGFFGYRSGTEALRNDTYARVQEVSNERLKAIQDYIARQESAVLLGSQGMAVEASKAFNAAYATLASSKVTPAQRAALRTFYAKTFIPNLEHTTGQDYDVDGFVPSSPARSYLQANYTTFSGDADASIRRDDAGDGSAWTAANKTFNPYWRAAAERLGLDDVVMLDNTGNVVYTAYKGSELGSDVLHGEYRGGGLQKVYEEAVQSNSRDHVSIAGFESYLPAYGASTMFIASPIGTASQLTGVLVYELSSEKINGVLSGDLRPGNYRGLGKTGEVYIVGPGGTLRTDSRELLENPARFAKDAVAAGNDPDVVDRIVRTKTSSLLLKDGSEPTRRAERGEAGVIEADDYLGHHVLASYQPAEITAVDWVLIGKIETDEVLAPVNEFARNLLLATALVILLVCAGSVLMARVFTVPLNRLVGGVRAVAGGQLGAQVAEAERRDEFGDLGQAFNDMSSSLLSKQQLLEQQQAENDRILKGMMPEPVVERYRGGETEISSQHDDVSVVYAQVEGFDAYVRGKPPAESLELLNSLSRGFEEASRAAGIEKVRTLGSGYIGSSGLVVQRVDHARRVVDFAIRAGEMLHRFNTQHGSSLGLRAGIDCGTVSSGLVGRNEVVYNLWGEAVDLAYRVRTTAGGPGIYVTDEIKDRLGSGYSFEQVGSVGSADDNTTSVWRVQVGGPA